MKVSELIAYLNEHCDPDTVVVVTDSDVPDDVEDFVILDYVVGRASA